MSKRVVFCIPIAYFNGKPHPKTVESLEAELPLLEASGWQHGLTSTNGSPYISGARADMTRRALNTFNLSSIGPIVMDHQDVIFYIDHDLSWKPGAILKVLETPGDVVAGTYRTKEDRESYMGVVFTNPDATPIVRGDGSIKARVAPAGFLKVTAEAIDNFMVSYPELTFGPMYSLSIDLFNHGARDRKWWGEDYAFTDRYNAKCGQVWIVPDLDIAHWSGDKEYAGNFHEFLLRQPGGSKAV